MYLAERLRQFREAKSLSQGDIEKRTGLLRCYISRVENGHTVPAIETLEKIARALEVPLYQLFYEDEATQESPSASRYARNNWASVPKCPRTFTRIWDAWNQMSERDRRIFLVLAAHVANRQSPGRS